jgi:hypothetical protein
MRGSNVVPILVMTLVHLDLSDGSIENDHKRLRMGSAT